MALFPLILLKNKKLASDKSIINHELTHIRQQIELLIFPFYFLYLFNYIVNLLIYRNHYLAYRNIVFEWEAYNNERDYDYLKNRRLFAWWKKRDE